MTGDLHNRLYFLRVKIPGEKEMNACENTQNLQLWHERFAHQNKRHVKQILGKMGVSVMDKGNSDLCEGCMYGKAHKLPFPSSNSRTEKTGELVHVDLGGPMEVKSLGGARYYALFRDDYSNYRHAAFLKAKSEAISAVKDFILFVKNQTGNKVKTVRSDRGGEFVNKELSGFFGNKGIKHELTIADCPEQNGKIERDN